MSEETIANYLEGVKDAEDYLSNRGFRRISSQRKGWLCIDKFIRGNTVVKFLFGPPEWHCEVVVQVDGRAIESKDLVSNPRADDLIQAIRDNVEEGAQGVRSEPLWWAKLIELSLPSIE